MPRSISRCPSCGEPVTQFAAGCAICGADLVTARAAHAQRTAPVRRATGLLSVPRIGDDGLRIAIAVLVTIGAPMFGLLLDAWFAWQMHEADNTRSRNVMLLLATLAVASLMAPFWFWRLLHGA